MHGVAALSPAALGLPADAPPPTARPAGFGAELDRALGGRTGVVQATRTPLTGEEARAALGRAWSARLGAPPSEKTLALLVAQWAHETGRGASMYNYNFGGIKGTGPSGLSVVQRTREGSGSEERVINDRFRAYRSADEGAADFIGLLAKRYSAALEGARNGDPGEFVRGLRDKRYFTGDAGAYTRSISRLSEAALGSGFQSLGAGPGAARPPVDALTRAASVTPSESTAHRLEELWPENASFVSALALVDEIGRSAVRILAQQDERDARDTKAVT